MIAPAKQGVIALVQARMGSSRFPGKVLLPLAGEPMLVRLVERLQRCNNLERVIVATSDDDSDLPIVETCRAHHIDCQRGSLVVCIGSIL